jgi:hypothetical protein
MTDAFCAGDLASFEGGVQHAMCKMQHKTPEEQIAFASEMAKVWQAAAVRALEKLWVSPRPLPTVRFDDLIVRTCNDTIIRVLKHYGVDTRMGVEVRP